MQNLHIWVMMDYKLTTLWDKLSNVTYIVADTLL